MKITEENLKKLIKEAVVEQLQAEDFSPGLYKDVKQIRIKYWMKFRAALKAGDRNAAYEAFQEATEDAYEFGKSESETNNFSDNL